MQNKSGLGASELADLYSTMDPDAAAAAMRNRTTAGSVNEAKEGTKANRRHREQQAQRKTKTPKNAR